MDPYISVTERVGEGVLATTFSDTGSIPIIFRKWIFGDGVVLEGNGLATVNHNYLSYGEYDVTLVAQSTYRQYISTREKLIVVNELRTQPQFVISQSFNSTTGEYWRFYFDQGFNLIFENNTLIVKSKNKVTNINKWTFVDFNMHTNKMYVGTYSINRKEIETLTMLNTSPLTVSQIKTDILPDGNVKIDELKMWNVYKDLYTYYDETRGRAGYLDELS
jgi:predicted secreted protein